MRVLNGSEKVKFRDDNDTDDDDDGDTDEHENCILVHCYGCTIELSRANRKWFPCCVSAADNKFSHTHSLAAHSMRSSQAIKRVRALTIKKFAPLAATTNHFR